ncbi:sucrose-6-phosphate hydrolase [Glaciecola sp. KUL10]|nr:sucrose-6-phosphate hydrolase [Glaciecola sp. KUL10]
MSHPPTPQEIIRFLNKYRNQMLCGNTNYMVKSFMHCAYHQLFNVFLFEDLLIEDEELYININAISFATANN